MTVSDLDAARLLLAKLGIAPARLLDSASPPSTMPAIAEYIHTVAAAVPAGARTTYQPYWNRAARYWPDRRLDEITATDIGQFIEDVRAHALVRRNTRDGRSATEHAIAALRCLYRHAIADNPLTTNPASQHPKPHRLPPPRTALPYQQLQEIHHVAATTGNDPALDSLILRLHTETACRRGGALTLRPTDLNPDWCVIRLHEKAGTLRWQPVSPTLMHHLQQHADQRHANGPEQLLRYTDGRPITRRRYDHLWGRIGTHLPWVTTHQITTHWLRHTTLTWVERNFGHAIARAYAGHTTPDNATDVYTQATLTELATALTGEPHPLASPPHDRA